MLKTIALLFILSGPLNAADLYVCWNYQPVLPLCQNPVAALRNWKAGDRIWLLGSNFKLLMMWDVDDVAFGLPPAGTADVTITLKKGQPLQAVQTTRRKTNTSKTLPITVNKDTTVQVQIR